MEIQFNIKLRDLVRFNIYHSARRVWNWLFIVVAVAMFSTSIPDHLPIGAKVFIVIMSSVGAIAGVFVFVTVIAVFSYMPSKNRGVFGEHTLAITPDGVTETTPVNTASWKWASVPKVSRNGSYIYIYVQQHMAHIVPKRAFASRDEANHFYEAAMSAWKAAEALPNST